MRTGGHIAICLVALVPFVLEGDEMAKKTGGTRSVASAAAALEDGTGNLSKQHRDDLVRKLGAIRSFLEQHADTNATRLLRFAAELEKEVCTKKYGLVFEEHKEHVDVLLEHNLPVLTENRKRFVDSRSCKTQPP